MANIHDSGYKYLFSNKRIFRQLLETFVEQDWVQELDFDSAELVNKSFISEAYEERESDLIYKLKLRQRPFYIYILLEFQSTVDYYMCVRMLYYILSFYMDYISSHRKRPRKLPPVFPLLLYNGNRRWNAPLTISEVIEGNELLGKYGLHFEYFKIAENEYSQEKLLQIGNLISTLFLAESHYDIDMLRQQFLDLFEREEEKQSISLLLNWFLQLQRYGRVKREDYEALEHIYKSKEEVHEMLITSIQKEKEATFKKGVEEGKREGVREGVKKGEQRGRSAEKVRIAKALLMQGLSVDAIHQGTGLPVDEVEKIKRKTDI